MIGVNKKMGLKPDDLKPAGISLSDAYEKTRSWYRTNAPMSKNHNAEASLPLIQALPPANQLSALEIRTVLSEVIVGKGRQG
jgi:hypothetical protein